MSLTRSIALACFAAACTPAAEDTTPERPTLEPPTPEAGFQLSMEATVGPYEEAWLCAIYPIPIDAPAAVNWMEFVQTPNLHHMTLSTPSLTEHPYEPGMYDCNDLYTEMLSDQIMFYGNQGFAEGEMHLPEGVAATFPTGVDILHELHYVNATDQTIDLYSVVNAYTIPTEEVTSGIWGGQVRDEHIEIPANSEHTEWSRCVMNEDVDIIFLASHTHELGIDFTIKPFDGTTVGEAFYSNNDWHDPKIIQYDPPMHVPAGQGFEWSCTWRNTRAEPISYGLTSKDEMCNLAIVHMPFSLSARCEVVETSDGVIWTP